MSSTTVKAKMLEIERRKSVEHNFTVNVSSAHYSHSPPANDSNIPVAPGLKNIGNTCFLNAVLQCLIHTAPFVEGLKTCGHALMCSRHHGGFCCLCWLKKHVVNAFSFSGQALSPCELVHNLSDINHLFKANQQQDAHEFLRCMLDKVQESTEPNLVEQIFGGRSRSRLQCTCCRHVSDTYESILDLSLAIEDSWTLSNALKLFTQLEKIKESRRCEKCKRKASREKELKIEQGPEVLVLHLKRFKSNVEKIIDFVNYPLELDLKPFLSNPDGDNNGETKYDLYAVLVHHGESSSSGHYVCYVCPSLDSWYTLDDAKVTPVTTCEVLILDAYILFYKKKGTLWFSSLQV